MSRVDSLVQDGTAGHEAVRPLAAQEFEQIRKLAHRTFGLDLKLGKEELVSARLRNLAVKGGFRTFRDYYRHVIADRTGASLAAMIDALATNHTSFMREPDHFEFLRRLVAKEFGDRDPLELWCAACATGEEVWTLACTLSDALPSRKVHILATDISNKALAFASQATYSAERCHGLPPEWRARYFETEKNASLCVAGKIRAIASFRRLNLIEPFSSPRLYPLVFCRNVMIYFDRATQEGVVKRLTACLEPGGYLFVGHAESLTQVSHELEYIQPAVYRKPRQGGGGWGRSS